MGILRPSTEGQVEISLSSDDGNMYFDSAFITSSPVEAVKNSNGNTTYTPVTIQSVFDPVYYKDLINYCIETLNCSSKGSTTFSIRFGIIACGVGRDTWAQYEAKGCQLVGYSLPKFNRESGEVAQFSLTLQPSRVSKLLT